jgi:peptidyl-prolyl cis-trans isomerase A (cyclophilin A)
MFTKTSISINISLSLVLVLFAGCNFRPDKEHRNTSIIKDKSVIKELKSRPLTPDSYLSFLKGYPLKSTIDTLVITCEFGEIEIVLFQNTPLHRANFLHLVDKNYFNGTWFHRVSENHVIQAGNSDELLTVAKRKEIGRYRVPAEALDENLHFYGALAAARSYTNNPQKNSDPFEFYISLGEKYSHAQLALMEEKYNLSLNTQQREHYQISGGSPHLDGEHTVFGKVVRGMEVAENISRQKTDSGEWPLLNIPIKIRKKGIHVIAN